MASKLSVYTGLPGTGKTTALINAMRGHQEAGGKVALFLSSEHEELTRRKNVKPGGLMGCRTVGLNFPIDFVCSTEEASSLLASMGQNELAVFDEAHFFRPEIVNSWITASNRGVTVLVGTPSYQQLRLLRKEKINDIILEVKCECGHATATEVVYKENLTFPTHFCKPCHAKYMNTEIDQLLDDVKESKPFPGELHTYQPFYSLDMSGWQLVRGDSEARLAIIRDAATRCAAVSAKLNEPVSQPTFLDLGCCSGFFADGMNEFGFRASGVDVGKHFIDWANRLAKIQGKQIDFIQDDAHHYMVNTEKRFDVASTFATVQWVMVQKGYETGLDCFKVFFSKTDHIAVVEMGYTVEEIYKDKIDGAPGVIDKDWVLELMKEHGDFATIEVHHAGENGIWRDVFVGFKEVPTPRPFRRATESKNVVPTSNAVGYSDDAWIAPTFEVYLKANKRIKVISLEGWRPDNSNDETATISFRINRTTLGSTDVKRGVFKISQETDIEEGETFSLTIQCDKSELVDGDDRQLSYLLRELSFS